MAPLAEVTEGPAAAPAWRRVLSGVHRLVGDRVLRTLMITVAVMVAANAAIDSMLVLYATMNLHMAEAVYPTLLAAYSVGTLVAAALAGRLASRFRGGRVLLVALAGIGTTMLVMGIWVAPAVALICYAAMGVAGGTWNVLSAARRQRRTPLAMTARVSSAFRVVAWGVMPVGAGLAGVFAQVWSVPAVFLGAGAVVLLLGAVVGRTFWAHEPPALSAS